MSLEEHGFAIFPTMLPGEILDTLRDSLFRDDCAGERCLLDQPVVRETALILRKQLSSAGHLGPESVAIQAIAFNKTAAKNWKVAWHQDLMFPVTAHVTSGNFDLPTIKQGVHHARPPATVLAQLLAVRLHLDDCDATNGPLRVSPGTHRLGILSTGNVPDLVANHGETTALAKKGEALLMRPLLLHASSQSTEPKHRRVLHFVYDTGNTNRETWHRAI